MLTTPSFSPLVVGVLKGYDQLMNLVLDDVKETLRGTCAILVLILVLVRVLVLVLVLLRLHLSQSRRQTITPSSSPSLIPPPFPPFVSQIHKSASLTP